MDWKTRKSIPILSLPAGLALLATLLIPPGALSASANATVHHVAPGGNCGGASPCYASIQDAVDAASDGDEIRIAQGTFTGVSTYDGKTSLVRIRQRGINLTIRGGYTTTDWEHPDPAGHPTVLDAQDQGMVLYMICANCPSHRVTIEGVHITGGYASQSVSGEENGGGIHIEFTDNVTIQNCQVYSNTADDDRTGGIYYSSSDDGVIQNNVVQNNTGEGISLSYSNSPDIVGNTVTGNSATGIFVSSPLGRLVVQNNIVSGNGRGIWLDSILNGVVEGNTIVSNTVGSSQPGGGIMARWATLTIRANVIRGNESDRGGGLYLGGSNNTIIQNNLIESNRATVSYDSEGGGMYLNVGQDGSVSLLGNTVTSNTANSTGGGAYVIGGTAENILVQGNVLSDNSGDRGGGLYVNTGTVSGNSFTGNTARLGGGLYANPWQSLTLTRNLFRDNQANENGGGVNIYAGPPVRMEGNRFIGNRANGSGGGLYSFYQAPSLKGHIYLTNTLVVENSAAHGSGLYIYGGSAALKHTTLANNGGGSSDGVGLYVQPFSVVSVTLTNTIVASQTVGVYTDGGDVSLTATLWGGGAWDNGEDWGGGGNILTGTLNYWGDPLFVNPAGGDYHIAANSPARDKGVDAGAHDDVDGETRPHPDTDIPDLGADEYHLDDKHIYLPLVVRG